MAPVKAQLTADWREMGKQRGKKNIFLFFSEEVHVIIFFSNQKDDIMKFRLYKFLNFSKFKTKVADLNFQAAR